MSFKLYAFFLVAASIILPACYTNIAKTDRDAKGKFATRFAPGVRGDLMHPPDSVSDWVNADSSISADGMNTKRIVIVVFTEKSTLPERQAALDSVDGIVVGGLPIGSEGYFYVQVPDSGSGVQLQAAIDKLSRMPQIDLASLDYRLTFPLALKE